MKAVIFGKYPDQFVREKITPKLQELGIDIEGIESRPSNFSSAELHGIDIVLFMSELAAHKELEQIKPALKRSNAKLVYLSRKSSNWKKQFERAGIKLSERKMARPPAVQDLHGFFLTYIKLKRKGFTHEDMAPVLRKYWPQLKGGKNIASFISRMRQPENRDKLPPFFLDFTEHGTIPKELLQDSQPPPEPEAKQLIEADKISEDDDLLAIADEELRELRDELNKAREEIDSLKKRSLNESVSGISLLKENANIIKRGSATGLFTPNEALQKLIQIVDEL